MKGITGRRLLMIALAAAVTCMMMLTALHKAPVTGRSNAGEGSKTALKTLTIAQSSDADTIDPSDIGSTDTLNIARLIWATLYEVSPDGQVKPYLAESSQYAEDGRSITFKLRAGLTCEDGSPLTARDVAYTFDRANDPKMAFTGNASGFVLPSLGYEGSRVDDRLTVTLLVKKYNPIALGLLSEMMIVCRAPYEKMTKDEAATHAFGTGPYRLVEWAHDDHIVLERNRHFILKKPAYDRIIFRFMPEASTRSSELIAGNVDIITNVAPDQIDAINSSDTAKVESVASTRRIYIGFNQKQKFSATAGGRAIKDPAVRLALQHAVDVPSICESLLRTPCVRPATLVMPHNDHSGIKAYTYDPDEAERMLDAAGYPRGKDGVRFQLKLQAPRGRYLEDANVALAVGQYLTDVGVKTEVEVLDVSSVYIPLTRQHDAGPIYLQGTGGATWSALYDLSDMSTPTSGTNYTSWADPEFFAGWRKLEKTRDSVEQEVIINEMLRVFHERGTWLLLYFQPDIYGVSNRISWRPRADEVIAVD